MDQYAHTDLAQFLAAAEPLLDVVSEPNWLVYELKKKANCRLNKKPLSGFSTADPTTWVSLGEAVAIAERHPLGPDGPAGVGFVIVAGLMTFDFDDCVEADGTVAPEVAAMIEQLDSFTYTTVSGTGMRVVMLNDAENPIPGLKRVGYTADGHKVEIFIGPHHSYNTFSPTEVNGKKLAARGTLVRRVLKELTGTPAPEKRQKANSSSVSNFGAFGVTSDLGKKARDQEALFAALMFLPPDLVDREEWINLGLAFYAGCEGSEAGREVWLARAVAWLGPDDDHEPHLLEAEALWDSFEAAPPHTIGAGTVFAAAKKHGWKWPEETLELDQETETGGEAEAVEVEEGTEVLAPKFSEAALARRFARRHRKHLRYVAEWGQWLWWDGTVWQKDRTNEVLDAARRICEEQAATCIKATQARSITKVSTARGVLAFAAAMTALAATPDQWDADPWLLNTPGGVVDLHTGQMRKHRATDYMTKITAVAPDAACPCPRWLKFLDEIMAGDKDRVDYLQRHCGYSLTGDTSEEMMWFGHGKGRNGKSKFVELRLWIMGDYAGNAAMETFTASKTDKHPTELARLQGLRLVAASETEEGRQWAENRIKMMTGGDLITAHFMRCDDFTFKPQFKLFIIGNHKPRLRNVDEAIKWRLQLIPFSVVIPVAQRDKQLMDKLTAEGPGILAWMVKGAVLWQQQGMAPPKAVREATDDYINTEDALGSWLAECCETGDGRNESTRQLYLSYQQWMQRAGERHPATERRFVQALTDRGFKKIPWTNHREPKAIEGLRLKEVEPEEGEDDL